VTTVAAIDCGTNSIRLLIAESDGAGGLRELDRRMEIVRLGQGVDATGQFHPDALQRTFAATDAYAEAVRAVGVPVERIRFVATSASRDASNRDEFFEGIRERLGVAPDVISGDVEARLSFAGALSGIDAHGHHHGGSALVMDIGGGSTELILGHGADVIEQATSIDVGSVRLTERFLKVNPTPPAARAEAEAYVDELLDECGIDFSRAGTWIGVAGTMTTLAGVYLGLEAYDRTKVHRAVLSVSGLTGLLEQLAEMTVPQIKAIPSMHPGRADVITGGALVASRVAQRVTVDDLIISESDILDGIALELLT
jgi:exopolyphosphatase / guanosine-5'-triphosphate,3'-diphosphate pyrophosphatase